MFQKFDSNGKSLHSLVKVHPLICELFRECDLPHGLFSVVLETGLVLVKTEYKTQVGTITTKTTPMKLGKLLNKLGYDSSSCQLLSARLGASIESYNGNTLRITESQSEVLRVYRDGPNSCMKGESAVAAYCTDDVAVAYVMKDQRITARSVIDKTRKTYYSIYGDKALLGKLLSEAGYSVHSSDEYFLEGCKIALVKDGDNVLCPYIDGANRADEYNDHLLVTDSGEYDCQQMSGFLAEVSHCEACGCVVSDEDTSFSEYLEESLCDDCFNKVHEYVDGEWYHQDDDQIKELEDDSYVLIENAMYIYSKNEWHHIDDTIYCEHLEEDYLFCDTRYALFEEGEYDHFHIDDVTWHDGEWYYTEYFNTLEEEAQDDD